MGFTISQLKQVIREEIEKELQQGSEMGQEKALNKETKTLDVAKSISSWLQSKGISSKAFGRPAQRYTSLYGGRVGGGYVEPSVVVPLILKGPATYVAPEYMGCNVNVITMFLFYYINICLFCFIILYL